MKNKVKGQVKSMRRSRGVLNECPQEHCLQTSIQRFEFFRCNAEDKRVPKSKNVRVENDAII